MTQSVKRFTAEIVQQNKTKVTATLAVGTVATIGLVAALPTVLGIALSLTKLAGAAIILGGIWYFAPTIMYGMDLYRRKLSEALTRANPIEALSNQLDQFVAERKKREASIDLAVGHLNALKKEYAAIKDSLSPEQVNYWVGMINKIAAGVDAIQRLVDDLRTKEGRFRSQIRVAEAEYKMAEIAMKASNAADPSAMPDLSATTRQAFDQIAVELGTSMNNLDRSLRQLQEAQA